MREVYSHALCKIAAISATDSSIGLSFDRSPLAINSFWVETQLPYTDHEVRRSYSSKRLVVSLNPFVEDLDRGPLNQRAWVLQERFLSPRIMRFTSSQVFWECYEDCNTEVFAASDPG